MEAGKGKASWTYAVESIVGVVNRSKRDWWMGRHGRVGSGYGVVVKTNLARMLANDGFGGAS